MAELGRPWALATGYDIAFLHLVMVTLEGAELVSLPCTAFPLRKLPVRRLSEPARRWMSAVQVLLMEAKCRDDAADEGSWKAALGLRLVKKQAARAAEIVQESGFSAETITALIERQRCVEQRFITLEEYSMPTSLMLGEVFAHAAGLVGKPELRTSLKQLGQGLGSAIYIKDALDDLFKDVRLGRFNALERSSSSRLYGATALRREVARAQNALLRLGLVGDEAAQILRELAPVCKSEPPARRAKVAGICEIFLCCDLAICCDVASLCGVCPCDCCCLAATEGRTATTSVGHEEPVRVPLHCPACGADLKETVLGKVAIDECGRCQGLWLDHGELEMLARKKSLPGRLLEVRTTQQVQTRPEGTRPCPRCSSTLVGTVVKGVRLDLCSDCQGLWFDQGELNSFLTSDD